MLKFVLKRLLAAIPTLIVTFTFVFIVVRIIPGDAAYIVLGEDATLEEIAEWRTENGLDKPILVQYVDWVGNIFKGDLGDSLINRQPVVQNILMYIEPTILLVLMSNLIAVLLGIPAGVISALKRDSWIDKTLMTASMVGVATPSFWLGLMLCLWFAVQHKWFPATGYKNIEVAGLLVSMKHLFLPALSLGVQRTASIARFTRSCMLDVLRSDYVRTARAKGVGEFVITMKHMLRTTMGPVVTTIGLGIAQSFGGALVTERVFNIPGIGLLAYNSISTRDQPQIQAIIVYVAMVYIVINIILDILYKYFDPRIQLD